MKKLILVDSNALPDVYSKTLEAKLLLENGEILSVAKAAEQVGISRSAYYKYKDSVFFYNERSEGLVTIQMVLRDKPGVLSGVLNILYAQGANILTINQNIPSNNRAPVSVSFRTEKMMIAVDELTMMLKNADGVKTIFLVGNN